MNTPEALLISIEKLLLGVTDNLDPYIQLRIVAMAKHATDVAYLMGAYDGARNRCESCKEAK